MHKPNRQGPSVAQRLDEIFDIVDEQDRVIGQATRGEVHARNLWHRATHVVLLNSADEIFLQKRSMAKDTAPGCWDSSCSGHLDAGEEYRTAAVRELMEEIGVKTSPESLVFRQQLSPCPETGWEFVAVFTLRSDAVPVINLAEIERGAWFTLEQIVQRIAEEATAFTSAFRLHWPQTKAAIATMLRR